MVTVATGLRKRGHEIVFFVYYPQIDHFRSTVEDAGIEIVECRKSGRLDFGPPRALRRLVAERRFDVSLSFLTTPNIYNVLACRGLPTAAVVSERSAFPQANLSLQVKSSLSLYRLADHIVVNSRHHRERIVSEFKWIEPKSSTIANGIDLDRFHPGDTASAGRSEGPPSLLAVGSIHVGKNYKGLIEALAQYRTAFGEPPRVSWVGRDPSTQRDRVAFDRAQERIEELSLGPYWRWLGVRRDVPDLLRLADAFIHPSLFEGLPNAVCEALASGCPVLASNTGDHGWLLGDNRRGFLFDPKDPNDIAAAVRRFILLTSAQRHEMSRDARRFAERHLSVDGLVDAYVRLFESLKS